MEIFDEELWRKYRGAFQEIVKESEGEFEKRLLYITSGAIALSFTFISGVITLGESVWKSLLFAGWALLIISLIINLLSHLSSAKKASKSISDIDDELKKHLEEKRDTAIRENIRSRNRNTRFINRVTLWFTAIGITLILLFATINISQDKSADKEAVNKINNLIINYHE